MMDRANYSGMTQTGFKIMSQFEVDVPLYKGMHSVKSTLYANIHYAYMFHTHKYD